VNDDRDMDERLRSLLEPDLNAVDRLVAAALGPTAAPLRRRSRMMLWALAVAGAFACVTMLVRFNARSPEAPDQLIITPDGDVVLVQCSSGDSWIIGPERPDDWLPAGTGFVIVEGEMK
jgi:hypothetical protein